jgi:hypothetical protein
MTNKTRPAFFALWWWQGLFACRDHGHGLWRNVWCWVRGYHGPVVWYTTDFEPLEPDMRCRDCGEDLG